MKMSLLYIEVQQAGLGLIGWALVFFVLIPVMSSLFKSKKDEDNPSDK